MSRPVAILLLGCPASGRRTVADALDRGDFVRVDPMLVWCEMPEYTRAIEDGDRNAAFLVHHECCAIARQIRGEAIAARRSVILSGAGLDTDPCFEMIERLRSAGYETVVVALELRAETAVRRAVARGRRRGIWIREQDIWVTWPSVLANFDAIGARADNYLVFDNDEDAPRLVGEMRGLAARRGGTEPRVSVPTLVDRIHRRAPPGIAQVRSRPRRYEPGDRVWCPPPDDAVCESGNAPASRSHEDADQDATGRSRLV